MRVASLSLLLGLSLAAQSVEVDSGPLRRFGAITTSARGLTLPAGEFTIADMIDGVAHYLCRNYIYDPVQVLDLPGFTLQRVLALDALGAEEVLYSLLATRNLTALPLDEARGLYEIVSIADKSGHPVAMVPWRRPQDILRRPHLRELANTTVTVRNLDAQQVANALRNHFATQRTWQPGVPTVAAVGPRALLLSGYSDQLAEVTRAIADLDQLATPPLEARHQQQVEELSRRIETLERELAALKRMLAAKRR